jgi:16S rRNA (uracil1498-N3)-methyltransferase
MVEWTDFCRSPELPARRILGHPGGESNREIVSECDTVAAVGPEGGFTDEEVAMAREAGWRLLDLGPRILRVETAAIALAVLLG